MSPIQITRWSDSLAVDIFCCAPGFQQCIGTLTIISSIAQMVFNHLWEAFSETIPEKPSPALLYLQKHQITDRTPIFTKLGELTSAKENNHQECSALDGKIDSIKREIDEMGARKPLLYKKELAIAHENFRGAESDLNAIERNIESIKIKHQQKQDELTSQTEKKAVLEEICYSTASSEGHSLEISDRSIEILEAENELKDLSDQKNKIDKKKQNLFSEALKIDSREKIVAAISMNSKRLSPLKKNVSPTKSKNPIPKLLVASPTKSSNKEGSSDSLSSHLLENLSPNQLPIFSSLVLFLENSRIIPKTNNSEALKIISTQIQSLQTESKKIKNQQKELTKEIQILNAEITKEDRKREEQIIAYGETALTIEVTKKALAALQSALDVDTLKMQKNLQPSFERCKQELKAAKAKKQQMESDMESAMAAKGKELEELETQKVNKKKEMEKLEKEIQDIRKVTQDEKSLATDLKIYRCYVARAHLKKDAWDCLLGVGRTIPWIGTLLSLDRIFDHGIWGSKT